MPDIQMRFGKDILVLEGAMGTMLQRAGMEPGTCPEFLNVVEPDMISQIHTSYHMAGSDCATSNTFGGSRTKLAEFDLEDQLEEINRAGVRLARSGGAPHILADIGPTGLVMEPLGTVAFEEVFDIFAEQARALASESPDAFLLETFTDIAELRVAVLACKSVSDLPVIACGTFGQNGRMDLSGTDPATAAIILEAAGADAVGMNCGVGPEHMIDNARAMVKATALPVFAQPNAGLPTVDFTGTTVYPGTPDEMARFAVLAREAGLAGVGSCCGTSPKFTGAIAIEIGGKYCVEVPRGFSTTVVASSRAYVEIGSGPLRVIGERINPTGKPELKESLLAGSMSIVRRYGAQQSEAHADLLDVNVGAAGVDAREMLPKAVGALTGVIDTPLVLDTTDYAALEAALRVYPGKALINSVNGEPASYEAVLPLAKKYGAALVVLALDDNGIPKTAEGRLAVVEHVRAIANGLGIPDKDLLVDSLVMAAAADPDAPKVTLDATALVKKSGLNAMLGVSNVSHGLPMRGVLNAAFLTAAASLGLDCAIVNPNDSLISEAVKTINAGRENGASDATTARREFDLLLERALEMGKGSTSVEETRLPTDSAYDPEVELRRAIAQGDAQGAPAHVDALIEQGLTPAEVIGDVLTPAIKRLGDGFGRGEVFLPQLMAAADAMKVGVARAKSYLNPTDAAASTKGRVVFATVKGDIHSIGKDICISLLESQGFEVNDLGVDVAPETVAQAAADADAVCLSALMTTTLPSMEATKKLVVSRFPEIPVLVGGAVVTPEWAAQIGAYYSANAPECVETVSSTIKKA